MIISGKLTDRSYYVTYHEERCENMKYKFVLYCLCVFFILVGCGKSDTVSKEQYDAALAEISSLRAQNESSNSESTELSMIDGFEKAEYSKFNSLASENVLDGTPIYIEGRITDIFNINLHSLRKPTWK